MYAVKAERIDAAEVFWEDRKARVTEFTYTFTRKAASAMFTCTVLQRRSDLKGSAAAKPVAIPYHSIRARGTDVHPIIFNLGRSNMARYGQLLYHLS